MLELSNLTLAHPKIQSIMKEESFDLVIVSMIGNAFSIGLAAHFKCPLVVLTRSQAPHSWQPICNVYRATSLFRI